jgi:hypothetical protein
MSFGSSKVTQTPIEVAPWSGDDTGLLENFQATWDDDNLRHAANGLEVGLEDAWEKNWQNYTAKTGESSAGSFMLRHMFLKAAMEQEGYKDPEPDGLVSGLLAGGIKESDIDDRLWAQLQEDQGKLAAYRELNPHDQTVQTFPEMWATLKAQNETYMKTAADVADRATLMGGVGSFSAALAAGMNPRTNFLNVASVGIGGVGTTVPRRIASEIGIGAGIEAVNQFTGVALRQELLGTPTTTGQKLVQVGFAGLGAGALRGLGEGAPVAFKAAERKIAPGRAVGRELKRRVEGGSLQNFKADLENSILQMDPRFHQGENARADLSFVAEQSRILFARANPYGDTDIDHEVHVDQFMNVVEPIVVNLRDRLNGSTRVPSPIHSVEFKTPDFDATRSTARSAAEANRDPRVADAARSIDPVLIGEYERLRLHNENKRRWLDDLGGRAREERVDRELVKLTDRISELEAEKAKATSKRLAKKKQKEIDTLIEQADQIRQQRFAEDTPDMARVRSEIIATDERLRDMAPQVSEAYTKARKKVEATIPKETPRISRTGREAISGILDRQEIRKADPIKSMLEAIDPGMINGRHLYQVAEDMMRDLERTDPHVVEHNAAEVDAALRAVNEEDGTVDLGPGVGKVAMDDTFIQLHDMDGGTVSLREFLDEAKLDDELVQSMTVCAVGGAA